MLTYPFRALPCRAFGWFWRRLVPSLYRMVGHLLRPVVLNGHPSGSASLALAHV